MLRLRALGLAMGASTLVVVACSQSQAPLGKGDDFDAEVADASNNPPPVQDAANYDDGFFLPVDGYALPTDGYAPYSWCSKCKCPAGTFCFGGASGIETFNGDCHTAGGALSSSLTVGCYSVPSACTHGESPCACLIQAVSAYVPCYPVCSTTTNIVYCPNP